MAIEEELRTIRTAISKRINEKAHATVEVDNAKARLAALSAEVKEKYGVTDSNGLKVKLQELQEEYNTALQEAKDQLAQASE
jgi:hypothetical protein